MGVSFRAYSDISHLPEFELDDTLDDPWEATYENNIYWMFAYPGFHQSTRGLINHDKVSEDNWLVDEWYQCGPSKASWETSYGWYGLWRKSLSKACLGVKAKKVWADPTKYEDEPFFELINFADNEGTIGPTACSDLLIDFEEHRQQYVNYIGKKYDTEYERSSFIRFYDEFHQGLEATSPNGCIRLS